MNLMREIDRAIQKCRDRMDSIDDEIMTLASDLPNDPDWMPRDVAEAMDRLHDEFDMCSRQLAVLLKVRPQVAA